MPAPEELWLSPDAFERALDALSSTRSRGAPHARRRVGDPLRHARARAGPAIDAATGGGPPARPRVGRPARRPLRQPGAARAAGGAAPERRPGPGAARGRRARGRVPHGRRGPRRLHRPRDLRPPPPRPPPPALRGRGQRRAPDPDRARRLPGPHGLRHRPVRGARAAQAERRGRRRGAQAPLRRRRGPLRSRRAARAGREVHQRGRPPADDPPAGDRPLGAPEGEDRGRDPEARRRAARAPRAARERARLRVQPRHPVAAGDGVGVPLRGHARPAGGRRGGQARHGAAAADGPAGLRGRRVREDRDRDPRRVQGGPGRQAGGRPRPDDRARHPAPRDVPRAAGGFPRRDRRAVALQQPPPSRAPSSRASPTAGSTS